MLVHPATAHDLAFLTPGLVHQFGNLLLTIHGHAMHGDPANPARSRDAIGGACERGSASLRLLRHLLGGGPPERGEAARALAQLSELLRIPVREAGHVLAVDESDGDAAATVDLAWFVALAVGAVRSLLQAAPTGMRGVLTLALRRGPDRLQLALRQEAGNLPFPLTVDETVRQLTAHAARIGGGVSLRRCADGIEILLPAAAGVAEA